MTESDGSKGRPRWHETVRPFAVAVVITFGYWVVVRTLKSTRAQATTGREPGPLYAGYVLLVGGASASLYFARARAYGNQAYKSLLPTVALTVFYGLTFLDHEYVSYGSGGGMVEPLANGDTATVEILAALAALLLLIACSPKRFVVGASVAGALVYGIGSFALLVIGIGGFL